MNYASLAQDMFMPQLAVPKYGAMAIDGLFGINKAKNRANELAGLREKQGIGASQPAIPGGALPNGRPVLETGILQNTPPSAASPALPPQVSVEEQPDGAPVGHPQSHTEGAPIAAIPALPKTDTSYFDMVNGLQDKAQGKFDANNKMMNDMLDSRIRTRTDGATNPLGAIAASRQAGELAGGIRDNNDASAGSYLHGMQPALQAMEYGNKMRDKQNELVMQNQAKLNDPMFASEKAYKEAHTNLYNKQADAQFDKKELSKQRSEDKATALMSHNSEAALTAAREEAKLNSAIDVPNRTVELLDTLQKAQHGYTKVQTKPAIPAVKNWFSANQPEQKAEYGWQAPKTDPHAAALAHGYTPEQIAAYKRSKGIQ
jgi:hypothetical protein